MSPKDGSSAPVATTAPSATVANPTGEGSGVGGAGTGLPPPAPGSGDNPAVYTDAVKNNSSASLTGATASGNGSGRARGGSGGTGSRGRGLRKSPIRSYPHCSLSGPASPNATTHRRSAAVDNSRDSSSKRDEGVVPYSRQQRVSHHHQLLQHQHESPSSSIPRHIKDRIQEGKCRTRGSVGILPTISEHGRESPVNSNKKSTSSGSRQSTGGPEALATAAGNLVCTPRFLLHPLQYARVCVRVYVLISGRAGVF